jgi:hypothetical protein
MPRLESTFRGDTRDEAKVRDSGGFVPKYLLRTHQGDFDGFQECKKKEPYKMGCRCDRHTENHLYVRAREKLQELLLKPNGIQEQVLRHIGSQTVDPGLLSAGRKVGSDDEAFQKEFVYEIRNKWEVDAPLKEAVAEMGLQLGKLSQIFEEIRLVSNSTKLSEATVFGFVPKGGVEVSYVSPIADEHIELNRIQPQYHESPAVAPQQGLGASGANGANGAGGHVAPPPPPPPPPP